MIPIFCFYSWGKAWASGIWYNVGGILIDPWTSTFHWRIRDQSIMPTGTFGRGSRGRRQVVRHQPSKLIFVGSSPIARSYFLIPSDFIHVFPQWRGLREPIFFFDRPFGAFLWNGRLHTPIARSHFFNNLKQIHWIHHRGLRTPHYTLSISCLWSKNS